MSNLLKEIQRFDRKAVNILKEVGLQTDDEIRTLTRDDLRDLFPGQQNFKLRRKIFEIIQEQRTADVLLKELTDRFSSCESCRASLMGNGALIEYLQMWKELKTQVNKVQMFIDSHVDRLEKLNKHHQQEETKAGGAPPHYRPTIRSTSSQTDPLQPAAGGRSDVSSGGGFSVSGLLSSISYGTRTSQTEDYRPAAGLNSSLASQSPRHKLGSTKRPSAPVPMVTYGAVISGVTFNSHLELLNNVTLGAGGQKELELKESQSPEDVQILIVFCPVSSRLESDVEAAMKDVQRDKPVILVLMHHTWDPTYIPYQRAQSGYGNVVKVVNVLFHETKGLLKSMINEKAALEMQKELLKFSKQQTSNVIPEGGWLREVLVSWAAALVVPLVPVAVRFTHVWTELSQPFSDLF